MSAQHDEGRRLLEAGQIEQAEAVLQEILRTAPTDVKATFLLGVCHFRRKQLVAAEDLFRRVIGIDERHSRAWYYLGLAHERQARPTEAREAYRRALDLDPAFNEARAKLGQPQNLAGDTVAARAEGTAPAQGPGSPMQARAAAPPPASHAPTFVQPEGGADPGMDAARYAGELLLSRFRRMRSFSGHWLLTMLAFVAFVLVTVLGVAEDFEGDLPEAFVIAALAFLALAVSLWARSRATRFDVYERRIEFKTGLLFRKQVSVWVYQIEDAWLRRGPCNLITGDATVILRASGLESHSARPSQAGTFRISGLGDYSAMDAFWREVRDAALVERRQMKKWWV